MYEIIDVNKISELVFPNNVRVTNTIDDIRLKSNLKINQTLIFAKKSFFNTLGLVQSYSRALGDINGFIQLIPGYHRNDKAVNNNGFDINQ